MLVLGVTLISFPSLASKVVPFEGLKRFFYVSTSPFSSSRTRLMISKRTSRWPPFLSTHLCLLRTTVWIYIASNIKSDSATFQQRCPPLIPLFRILNPFSSSSRESDAKCFLLGLSYRNFPSSFAVTHQFFRRNQQVLTFGTLEHSWSQWPSRTSLALLTFFYECSLSSTTSFTPPCGLGPKFLSGLQNPFLTL